MKLLIVTNLFPNAAEPNRATFNFQQFSALAKLCELKVVAPVPFFQHLPPPRPSPIKGEGDQGKEFPPASEGPGKVFPPPFMGGGQGEGFSRIPYREVISGIEVFHPRYLAIPKILRFTHGPAFFLGIWHTLKIIQQTFEYDAILAAWAYPDAYGTALAAGLLKKKFFVKVQGSDINLAHKYWIRVPMVRRALRQAEKVIAVSRPLKDKLTAIGIPGDKVVVIPNGVDKSKFFPRDKGQCRRELGLEANKKYVLCVGNLARVKGVEYLIRAFATFNVPGADLVIVGDGPLRGELEDLAGTLGIKDRVMFKGRQSYEDIPLWLNAADVLCLPSLNEGCPNVVLEALACGTKVVASNVGGVPDIIDTPAKGWLAKPGDPDDLARQLKIALEAPASSTHGESMSWEENAQILYKALQGAEHVNAIL
jgi:teichuronic acid biosynthesis glycosyltransferase TuaC